MHVQFSECCSYSRVFGWALIIMQEVIVAKWRHVVWCNFVRCQCIIGTTVYPNWTIRTTNISVWIKKNTFPSQKTVLENVVCKIFAFFFGSQCDNINTLRPRQNDRHLADGLSKCISLNENVWMMESLLTHIFVTRPQWVKKKLKMLINTSDQKHCLAYAIGVQIHWGIRYL